MAFHTLRKPFGIGVMIRRPVFMSAAAAALAATIPFQAGKRTSTWPARGGSTKLRNIPDVALTADNVFVDYGNGSRSVFGGTSCAAPFWAGFIALVNQQAAANGKPVLASSIRPFTPSLRVQVMPRVFTMSRRATTRGRAARICFMPPMVTIFAPVWARRRDKF